MLMPWHWPGRGCAGAFQAEREQKVQSPEAGTCALSPHKHPGEAGAQHAQGPGVELLFLLPEK